MKVKVIVAALALSALSFAASAQGDRGIAGSPEFVKALNPYWEGPWLDDGRPYVSDSMIERLKKVHFEDAWAELMKLGYQNQYEGDWIMVNDDVNASMCGRVVTAQFMPMRPDYLDAILEQGKKEGRAWEQKRTVSWAIPHLRKGDVYVTDTYNKEWLGTAVGSNLSRGVFNATGNGIITYGHVRDIEGLRNIEGFNAWTKGYDPSYMRQTMLTSYNVPVRIGKVTVLPGDVVLAKWNAVLFIPAHLVEHIVITAEFTGIADDFATDMQNSRTLDAGQVDSVWSEEVNNLFRKWFKGYKKAHRDLTITDEEVEKCLYERNF